MGSLFSNGRVAQQSNDVGCNFELPKEVLQERENAWDNLFEKYEEEVSQNLFQCETAS